MTAAADPPGAPEPTAAPEPVPPYGESTRAVHGPAPAVPAQPPLGLPVYRTAAFGFDSAEDYRDVVAGERAGYSYSRYDNPTADAFAAAVAALEGAGLAREVVGQPFASGMAAISAVLWTLTRAGGRVVAPREIYGGTYSVLTRVLARFGVRVDFVDGTDPAAVRAAVGGGADVVWAETLANPTMSVADLPELAEAAHGAGAALVVDSTFASPVVCRPLEWGADIVVHSATKYIGGHSDATGGVAVGDPARLAALRLTRVDTGGSLAPDEAFLLHRGLATLPLRVSRQCTSALAFATAMAAHPRVVRVDYPGLATHRDHTLARRFFDAGPDGTRFGAVVTVTPAGGQAAGLALCNGLRLATVATSLGGTHSVVSHVASTTHRQFDAAVLAAAGIDPGAVRISVGLEDVADLVADVTRALDELPD
jgi:cystathionine beta-lyase/cystathionine gamma-synthase